MDLLYNKCFIITFICKPGLILNESVFQFLSEGKYFGEPVIEEYLFGHPFALTSDKSSPHTAVTPPLHYNTYFLSY